MFKTGPLDDANFFFISDFAGGVTRTTNEAILLCEAAGFNIIIGQELFFLNL